MANAGQLERLQGRLRISTVRPGLGSRCRLRVMSAACLMFAAAPMLAGSPRPTGTLLHELGTTRSVIDPKCNGGRGIVVPVPPSLLAAAPPAVATTVLDSGVALVVLSSAFPEGPYAVLHAFTGTCGPDRRFGHNGAERLAIGGRNFSILAAVPAQGGGAILAGEAAGRWLVVRIGPLGRLDRGFGAGGYAVLPWQGEVSAVAQGPEGRVVLGGDIGVDNEEGLAEVSEAGRPVTSFGRGGQVPVQVNRDDSELSRVAFEGNGDVLALTLGGNMGVWGVTVSAFRPNGSLVPSFQENFAAALGRAAPQVFVADLVVRPDGFWLAGTRQAVPVISAASPTASGEVVAFRADGSLNSSFGGRGQVFFPCPLGDPVWALPEQDGRALIVAETPATQATANARERLDLVAISAHGTVAAGFEHGPSSWQLPFLQGAQPASDYPVNVASNGRAVVVVSSTADGKALRLVELMA
ncbi:MAG TPA: hypothetical protein VME46_23065 [Acidimicrobiales bacterium]|nr:hypothetical protein [Acidimicrobiales bacterium]